MSALYEATQAARGGDFSQLIEEVPYAKYLGIEMAMRDYGVEYKLPFRQELVGNAVIKALHGGVVAGFMENVALLELLVSSEESRIPKTVDFSIDYLRSARSVDTYAHCTILRQGRRVAMVEIKVAQGKDVNEVSYEKPIAAARAHFLLSDPD